MRFGKIIRDEGGSVKFAADCEEGGLEVICPYGYSYRFPDGEEAAAEDSPAESPSVMNKSAAKAAASLLGTKRKNTPGKGEILISNAFGASILLANDGRVIINGKIFERE